MTPKCLCQELILGYVFLCVCACMHTYEYSEWCLTVAPRSYHCPVKGWIYTYDLRDCWFSGSRHSTGIYALGIGRLLLLSPSYCLCLLFFAGGTFFPISLFIRLSILCTFLTCPDKGGLICMAGSISRHVKRFVKYVPFCHISLIFLKRCHPCTRGHLIPQFVSHWH